MVGSVNIMNDDDDDDDDDDNDDDDDVMCVANNCTIANVVILPA
jgi:hypothetical protein